MTEPNLPTEARAVEAMVDAWFEADAHHAIEDTCRILYRAAMNAARPTPTDSDVEQRLFGEFGVFHLARSGAMSSNWRDKVAEFKETEALVRAALASLPDVEEVRGALEAGLSCADRLDAHDATVLSEGIGLMGRVLDKLPAK